MKKIIAPTILEGSIGAIASKSHAHRLLICAALSGHGVSGAAQTEIYCRTSSEDIDATVDCLRAMGAEISKEISKDGEFYLVRPVGVPASSEVHESLKSHADPPGPSPRSVNGNCPPVIINCKESGSTYRFLVPVAAALGLDAEFVLEGRLPERPMEPLWEVLETHGISISGKGSSRVRIKGQLNGGEFILPGTVSSQFISGLLFALPLLRDDSRLTITGSLESESYIKITIEALKAFGINVRATSISVPGRQQYESPGTITVEGDWSNAAFWLAAGAAGGREITCTGLNPESVQGDRAIVEILRTFGGKVEIEADKVTVLRRSDRFCEAQSKDASSVGMESLPESESGSESESESESECETVPEPESNFEFELDYKPDPRLLAQLKGIEIDVRDIPDLVPALAVVACAAEGPTKIINAGRLRLKESDRLFTVWETLKTLGADIVQEGDSLIINGSKRLKGGRVDSHGDHRIAMMAAIASVISEGDITIENAEAVRKSYPGFFEDFGLLSSRNPDTHSHNYRRV